MQVLLADGSEPCIVSDVYRDSMERESYVRRSYLNPYSIHNARDCSSTRSISVLTQHELRCLRDCFIFLDEDGDGLLRMEDLRKEVEVQQPLTSPTESQMNYLAAMFSIADKDRDGALNMAEFLCTFAEGPGIVPQSSIRDSLVGVTVELTEEDVYLLTSTFHAMDTDSDGILGFHEVKNGFSKVFEGASTITSEDLTEVTSEALQHIRWRFYSPAPHLAQCFTLSKFLRSYQEDHGTLPAALITCFRESLPSSMPSFPSSNEEEEEVFSKNTSFRSSAEPHRDAQCAAKASECIAARPPLAGMPARISDSKGDGDEDLDPVKGGGATNVFPVKRKTQPSLSLDGKRGARRHPSRSTSSSVSLREDPFDILSLVPSPPRCASMETADPLYGEEDLCFSEILDISPFEWEAIVAVLKIYSTSTDLKSPLWLKNSLTMDLFVRHGIPHQIVDRIFAFVSKCGANSRGAPRMNDDAIVSPSIASNSGLDINEAGSIPGYHRCVGSAQGRLHVLASDPSAAGKLGLRHRDLPSRLRIAKGFFMSEVSHTVGEAVARVFIEFHALTGVWCDAGVEIDVDALHARICSALSFLDEVEQIRVSRYSRFPVDCVALASSLEMHPPRYTLGTFARWMVLTFTVYPTPWFACRTCDLGMRRRLSPTEITDVEKTLLLAAQEAAKEGVSGRRHTLITRNMLMDHVDRQLEESPLFEGDDWFRVSLCSYILEVCPTTDEQKEFVEVSALVDWIEQGYWVHDIPLLPSSTRCSIAVQLLAINVGCTPLLPVVSTSLLLRDAGERESHGRFSERTLHRLLSNSFQVIHPEWELDRTEKCVNDFLLAADEVSVQNDTHSPVPLVYFNDVLSNMLQQFPVVDEGSLLRVTFEVCEGSCAANLVRRLHDIVDGAKGADDGWMTESQLRKQWSLDAASAVGVGPAVLRSTSSASLLSLSCSQKNTIMGGYQSQHRRSSTRSVYKRLSVLNDSREDDTNSMSIADIITSIAERRCHVDRGTGSVMRSLHVGSVASAMNITDTPTGSVLVSVSLDRLSAEDRHRAIAVRLPSTAIRHVARLFADMDMNKDGTVDEADLIGFMAGITQKNDGSELSSGDFSFYRSEFKALVGSTSQDTNNMEDSFSFSQLLNAVAERSISHAFYGILCSWNAAQAQTRERAESDSIIATTRTLNHYPAPPPVRPPIAPVGSM